MGPSVQFHISCNLPPTLDDFTLPHQLPFFHQRISKHQPRSCQTGGSVFHGNHMTNRRRREPERGAERKGAFIDHMNVVCAVLQTAVCASRHKRTGERPAERRTAIAAWRCAGPRLTYFLCHRPTLMEPCCLPPVSAVTAPSVIRVGDGRGE